MRISSNWEYSPTGCWVCSHWTDEKPDPYFDKDMMVRHIFLETLARLNIIQYERGYDGLYYDIVINSP